MSTFFEMSRSQRLTHAKMSRDLHQQNCPLGVINCVQTPHTIFLIMLTPIVQLENTFVDSCNLAGVCLGHTNFQQHNCQWFEKIHISLHFLKNNVSLFLALQDGLKHMYMYVLICNKWIYFHQRYDNSNIIASYLRRGKHETNYMRIEIKYHLLDT